jgi:hypothetical protein
MITGCHTILYSTSPEVDRAFLRDVIGMPHVDVGEGWLIFGLPPSEVAVHPSSENDVHEFYLIVADVDEFVGTLKKRRIACTPVQDMGWGRLTHLTLPGGGKLGAYQPRHPRPKPMKASGRGSKKKAPTRARASARAKPRKKRPARKSR